MFDDTKLMDRKAAAAPNRAADAIVAELEAQIGSGQLPDGAFLPAERELMAQFNISRTVAREAVARLAGRGLVEARPRFRPVVRRPGYDAALSALGGIVNQLMGQAGTVKNIYDTRVFLEAALVRHAALHARKDDLALLRQALEANEAAIGNSAAFYVTDIAFHAMFYELPRNPVMPAIQRAFTGWLQPHWQRMPRSPERNRVNYLSHRAIYQAIAERDPDGAERALNGHLAAAWEYVRGTFEPV
ncbi:MAG TPA: FCD domain-containing protein [Devosia sp.]|uniref:FCD domain-containing protein n=1 Tax=Devosia sp. TaxID=1871048 RepID=UPI002F939F7E